MASEPTKSELQQNQWFYGEISISMIKLIPMFVSEVFFISSSPSLHIHDYAISNSVVAYK